MSLSSSNKLYKVAADRLSAGAKELLKTEALRKLLLTKASENSTIGNSLAWLAKKDIPAAATSYDLYRYAHDKLLKADTYLGATLRGNAKKGDLRYSLLTNNRGYVPVEGAADTYLNVPRASILKPAQYLTDVAILPLTLVGVNSLKDPEENINPAEFGGINLK